MRKFAFIVSIITLAAVIVVSVGVFSALAAAAETPGVEAGQAAALEEQGSDAGANGGLGIGLSMFAAALSTGLAAIGAGIAVGQAAPAAIGAFSEDPKNLGKALIFVALGEGVALYGLLISILILNKF